MKQQRASGWIKVSRADGLVIMAVGELLSPSWMNWGIVGAR